MSMFTKVVIKAIVMVVVVALAGVISFAYRQRLRRRAEALDKAGCLSCGSRELEAVDARFTAERAAMSVAPMEAGP